MMRLKVNIYNKEDTSLEVRKVLYVVSYKDENSNFTVLDLIKQLITKYELSKKSFKWQLLFEGYELDKSTLINECLNDLDVVSLRYIKNQVKKEGKEDELKEANGNKKSFNQSKIDLSTKFKGTKNKNKDIQDDVSDKKIKKEANKKSKSKNEEMELERSDVDKKIIQRKINIGVLSKPDKSSNKEIRNGALTEVKENTESNNSKKLTKTQKRNLRRKLYLMNLAKQELEASFNNQKSSILEEHSNSIEKLQSDEPTNNEVKQDVVKLTTKNYIITRKNVNDSFNNEINYNESGYLNNISLNSEAFYNSLKNNDISNANKVDQSYSEGVKKDYDQMEVLDPKINPPKENQRIAFKVIELSDNYVPEISDFKEAIVISYNENTEEITYKLTEKVNKQGIQLDEDGNPILGKFELANNVTVEMGDTLIEYVNKNDTGDPVTVHYSSLLELKKIE